MPYSPIKKASYQGGFLEPVFVFSLQLLEEEQGSLAYRYNNRQAANASREPRVLFYLILKTKQSEIFYFF